jgi:hypothetical protein
VQFPPFPHGSLERVNLVWVREDDGAIEVASVDLEDF